MRRAWVIVALTVAAMAAVGAGVRLGEERGEQKAATSGSPIPALAGLITLKASTSIS